MRVIGVAAGKAMIPGGGEERDASAWTCPECGSKYAARIGGDLLQIAEVLLATGRVSVVAGGNREAC